MSISTGDILRVVSILSWLDGDIAQNVFNSVITGAGGPWTDGDIVSDALAWLSVMYNNVLIDLSDELDGSEARVYKYDSIDQDWDEVGSAAWGYNPSATAEQLPRGVAGLINCKTSDPDVNGKKYLPGYTEAANIDGLWSGTVAGRMGDFGDDWAAPFVGSVSGADWSPGIWSPTRGNFYLMTGTILVPTIPSYQRRRKNGIGI